MAADATPAVSTSRCQPLKVCPLAVAAVAASATASTWSSVASPVTVKLRARTA